MGMTLRWLVLGTTMAMGCTQQNMAAIVPMADGGTISGPVVTGLPCDVQTVLQNNCWSCHGAKPLSGVPMSLVTRADLMTASKSEATKTYGQVSLQRIVSTTSPMPPLPAAPLAAADVATLTAWVDANYPTGTCDATTGDPYATPTVCTSGTSWTRGDRGSSQMHPGGACINCHDASGEAPGFSFAGTVYPTAHEPDDCNGKSAIQVVLTGANGATITLTSNSAGNFFSQGSSLTMPFTAKVVANGKTRVMATPQTTGDCNSCHTETGAESAPGRIMVP